MRTSLAASALSRLLPLDALLGALALASCATLQPRSVVHGRVPASELVPVGGQLVHVEQSGAGEPVVLLHGFGESTWTWRLVAPRLAERFHVVVVDLNGFGYTDRPHDPAAYTLDGQQRLVLGVLDALGLPRAHFVGHSYGGALTLWIAARHPERVASMTLVDTAMPSYAATRRSRSANLRAVSYVYIRAVAMRESYVAKTLRAAYFDDALATPAVAREVLDRLRVEGIDDAYYGLTAKNGEPAAEVDLATIATPALVVWGREDTLTPLGNGERIARALPDARLVTVDRCGHVPMEETHDALLDALLPFLEARRSSR